MKAYATLMASRGEEDELTRRCALRLALMYEEWQKPDLAGHYTARSGKYR